MNNGLKLETLRALIEAGSVREAVAIGKGPSWSLLFKVGMTERSLVAQRGNIRQFRNLETALALVRDLGIGRASVDLSSWDSAQRSQ